MIDLLKITVEVTVGSSSHTVTGGAVRALDVTMTTYGVEGIIEFLQLDDSPHGGSNTDELFADFVKPDLCTVALSWSAVRTDRSKSGELPVAKTVGVVVERSVREEVFEGYLAAPSVLARRYRLRFSDRAKALWSQHFPCSLYTKKSLKEVFDAERGTVELTYDWDATTATRPQVFLGLDAERGVSFYDAAQWMLDRESGQMLFDHEAGTYKLVGEKPAAGTASKLAAVEVASMELRYGVPSRSKRRVVNVDAVLGARTEIAAPQAATGVFSDVLVRTSVQQQVDDRVTHETGSGTSDPRTIRAEFSCVPDVAVAPGSALSMPSASGFSSELVASSLDWRVYETSLSLRSTAKTPDERYGEDAGSFEGTLTALLELSTHTGSRGPSFVAPVFPCEVEGIVLSDVGAEDELTYESKQDETTQIDQFRVKIPVFDSQEVHPFYLPELVPGTVYLPAYKSAKVLVAFEFDRCRITRHLDWRPGGRPAADGQGQQVFLGKSETNNTRLLHAYESDKPVFELTRTNKQDTLLVRLEEGKMTLRVKEEEASS